MIIVAYEIHDYRTRKKDENEDIKRKWVKLEREPSASEIFCFMTCFVALFTGKLVLSNFKNTSGYLLYSILLAKISF